MIRLLLISMLAMVMIPTHDSHAEIFKWVDDNGKLHFSDRKPQSEKSESVKLKINTYTTPKVYKSAINFTSNNKVVMYGTTWCGVCKKAKRYFRKKGIQFKEYDVETSAKGKQDFKQLGGKGVPIIMVGEKRMDGFSVDHFERMYGG